MFTGRGPEPHPGAVWGREFERAGDEPTYRGRPIGRGQVGHDRVVMNMERHGLADLGVFDPDLGIDVDDTDRCFEKNEISESIVEEVTKRTPGFSGLQHERWLTHCLDACQYQGLASIEEIKQLSREEVLQAVDDGRFYSYCRDDNYWKELFDVYQGNRSVSFYKFSCLHCKKLLYYMDALYTFALRDFES